MFKSYKYELRPNDDQKRQLIGAIGSCRFVYNLALETKVAAYQAGKNLSCFDLINQLPGLKKDLPWLKNTPSSSLQQAITNLDRAYTGFFKGRTSFPAYKKKSSCGSFRIPFSVNVDFERWVVNLPKYGEISFNRDRRFKGVIKQVAISKTPSGKFFLSLLVDTGVLPPAKKKVTEESTVGIDLGLKHFAVLSDGRKIDAPKFLAKSQRALRRAQRSLARKKKGSKRRGIQRLVVARMHERVSNRRKDFLHKLSSEIANRYDSIALEDLNIAGLVKNRCLAKAISDAGWGEFNRMLEYKAEWKGKNILRIGRFEPSSKTCTCGHINSALKLSDRVWTCERCKTAHDRDLLAAGNIKTFGLRTKPATVNVAH